MWFSTSVRWLNRNVSEEHFFVVQAGARTRNCWLACVFNVFESHESLQFLQKFRLGLLFYKLFKVVELLERLLHVV